MNAAAQGRFSCRGWAAAPSDAWGKPGVGASGGSQLGVGVCVCRTQERGSEQRFLLLHSADLSWVLFLVKFLNVPSPLQPVCLKQILKDR